MSACEYAVHFADLKELAALLGLSNVECLKLPSFRAPQVMHRQDQLINFRQGEVCLPRQHELLRGFCGNVASITFRFNMTERWLEHFQFTVKYLLFICHVQNVLFFFQPVHNISAMWQHSHLTGGEPPCHVLKKKFHL